MSFNPVSQRFTPGFRMVDGSALNSLVDQTNAGLSPGGSGVDYFVNGADGSNRADGRSWAGAYASIEKALDVALDAALPAQIWIAPGAYDEALTIARPSAGSANLFLYGAGPRGSVYIAPSTTNAVALTNHADDLTIINVGCDGDGTGAGLVNTGSRLRGYGVKFEGDDIGLQLTLGTVAQEAAGTRGVGADIILADCEVAWAATGLLLTCTDYGAVTQVDLGALRFHDNATAAVDESVGSGGSASVMYRGLDIHDSTFERLEDGTEPGKYILLNDDNANSGIVTRCSFPTAINGGKNLVSTALIWSGNYHTGGLSTGQPS